MDTMFDRLVAESQEKVLPAMTRRDARLPGLPGKVDVVVGMRRSGKTWFLYQHMADLLAAGVPREAILYLNFEDERLQPLAAQDLGRIPDALYRRAPHLKERLCHFLFDEIQVVPGWERFVRRLVDAGDTRLTLTGSSARLLGLEIATSLRGRALATEVLPFSFREALRHAGVDVPGGFPGAKVRAVLEHALARYVAVGGFPEVQAVEAELRVRILQDYLDAVILRDVVERHGVTAVPALRALIRHAMNAPATPFSVHRFHNDLHSRGLACGKNTLHELLAHLEDAYLLFTVPIHSHSERARMVNPRKLYAIDPGLVTACRRGGVDDLGHLLENTVFLELHRRGWELDYYRTRKGREVDFLATSRDGTAALVQVCADLSDPAKRERELGALEEAMAETGIREAVVVTAREHEEVRVGQGTARLIPAWWWLLSARR